jgi:hypothetical protein
MREDDWLVLYCDRDRWLDRRQGIIRHPPIHGQPYERFEQRIILTLIEVFTIFFKYRISIQAEESIPNQVKLL